MKRQLSPSRLAAIAACCGASAVAAFGPGISSALAAETGIAIYGSGSSLQKAAQGIWSAAFPTSPGNLLSNPAASTVTYTSTSSGKGLTEFGDEGGKLTPAEDATANAAKSLDGFIGSDDPPTEGDMKEGENAVEKQSKQIAFPVAQAPVAVAVSLPTLVTASGKIDLSNKLLGEIWDAEVPASTSPAYAANTWGALLADAGVSFTNSGSESAKTGAYSAITLEARSAASGTTYTFRDYLFLLHNNYSYATKYEASNVSDSDAESSSGWPVKVSETGNEKGSELAKKAAETPGSIGYANLADAVNSGGFTETLAESKYGSSKQLIAFALIQDNGSAASAKYATPAKSESEKTANVDVLYKIRAGGTGTVGNWVDPTTSNGAWGNSNPLDTTYANDPNVYTNAEKEIAYYPIVAATFDVAWETYTGAILEEVGHYNKDGADVGNTVFAYAKYILSAEGQKAILKEYYAEVPSVPKSSAEEHQLKYVNGGKY